MGEDSARTEYDPFSRDEDYEAQRKADELRAARREHERWSREQKVPHLERDNTPTWIKQRE